LKLFVLITLVDFAELLIDFTVCIGQTQCSLEHYLVGYNFDNVLSKVYRR